MAKSDSNTGTIATNPMIGMFPDDTLNACSSVLAYLQSVRPMDVHSDSEITGLFFIHEVVRHALTYEIERVSAYRKGQKLEGLNDE